MASPCAACAQCCMCAKGTHFEKYSWLMASSAHARMPGSNARRRASRSSATSPEAPKRRISEGARAGMRPRYCRHSAIGTACVDTKTMRAGSDVSSGKEKKGGSVSMCDHAGTSRTCAKPAATKCSPLKNKATEPAAGQFSLAHTIQASSPEP
eukprot:365228-Chlamydomonas_euryale.AAC.4